MQISRRDALMGASAAVAVAGVPIAVVAQAEDAEATQVLALFRQMGDRERASVLFWVRYYAGLPDDPELMRRFARGAPS